MTAPTPQDVQDPSFNLTPYAGRVRLTKFGPEGTSATFSISATGGTLLQGSTVTLQSCPDDGRFCPSTEVWAATSDAPVQVTITEIAATGNIVVERISIISALDGTYSIWWPTDPTATVNVNGSSSAGVRFKNAPGENPEPPSLRVVKSAASGTVTAGSSMSFDMTVYSDGPGTAENVTLTDPLPGGAGVEWSTSTAGCSITGAAPSQTLSCAFGDMAAGATASVTVTSATSSQESCGTYANTVSVGADNHASVTSSATINVVDCYVPMPDLRVEKTAENGIVNAGETMSFSITVYSTGDAAATNVSLTDPLPGGNGVSWSTSTAGCSITGAAPNQTLSCDWASLAPGSQVTVTVTSATSVLNSCGTYANTVSVTADGFDPMTSSATIVVRGCDTAGTAGCTPGFWKQRQHFEYWTAPYTPNTLFSDVFANAFPGKTLLQVLGNGGGGLDALGRHTVAALLNAADDDVDYGLSTASVIAAFNSAYASGQYDAQKTLFERRNESGCTAKD